MEGRPVWLASVSKRSTSSGKILPAAVWSSRLMREGRRELLRVLEGVGDVGRERGFRMCVTLCIHRALRDDEVAALGDAWCAIPPRDMAGGPIEILWERGCVATPSTRPCEHPERQILGEGSRGHELYVPIECGYCPPCIDRSRRALGATTAPGGAP